MLRNSLLTVSADLNLSESDKLTLSPVNPVLINGQKLLPDTINYTPGVNGTKECSFRTCRLYTPTSTAVAEAGRYNTNPPYAWQFHWSDDWDENMGLSDAYQHPPYYHANSNRYDAILYDVATAPVFPPLPTQAQFAAGGQYHLRTFAVHLNVLVMYDDVIAGPQQPITKTYPATLTTWYEVVES